MSKWHASAVSVLAAVMALLPPLNAQSIISVRSGVIHFFEGAVYLNDLPLESRLGKYSTMPQGAELRTADGRAEVLLTPGVFLRMGDHSVIRMAANDLGNTQVELRSGHIIIDSGEPNPNTSVSLIYSRWRVHLQEKGIYRMDSDPAHLWVREGKAEAFASPAGPPVPVEQGNSLPFADVLLAERTGAEPADALSDWSDGRSQSIVADNTITAQIGQDPASQTITGDAFTYYPMLGLMAPSVGFPSSIYSSIVPSQPGFNSVYLPGYTYMPVMLMSYGGGYRSSLYSPLRPIGVSPGRFPIGIGTGGLSPRPPVLTIPRPTPIRIAPVPHPAMHSIGHK
jgi:hypothetical protein